jgi:hypothetical protein
MGRTCRTSGEKGMRIGYWWESQKKKKRPLDQYQDIDVDERPSLVNEVSANFCG